MPRKLTLILLAFGAFAVILGVLAYNVWSNFSRSNLKASLAAGYSTQPLIAPFVLTGKSWDPNSQTWQYNYSAALPAPDAITAAKAQLAKGAYQVDARQPDVIAPESATLYRDLITEDIALTVKISANSATSSAVSVMLSSMPK